MATYERTEDPNIIKRTRILEDEIHLDKLASRIALLERRIEEESGGKWYSDKVKNLKSLLKELESSSADHVHSRN